VIGPTYYPQSFLTAPSCSELVTSNGTSWSISVPFTCYPTSLKKQGNGFVTVPYPSGIPTS
jgi:hypothetical protein